ncbi:MAG: hypothetical protein P8182_17075, partial [Deltaproteobacteria bacterium]
KIGVSTRAGGHYARALPMVLKFRSFNAPLIYGPERGNDRPGSDQRLSMSPGRLQESLGRGQRNRLRAKFARVGVTS